MFPTTRFQSHPSFNGDSNGPEFEFTAVASRYKRSGTRPVLTPSRSTLPSLKPANAIYRR